MVGDHGHTWRPLLMGVAGASGGRRSELDAVLGARPLCVTGLLLALVSLVSVFASPALADTTVGPPMPVVGTHDALEGVACISATSCLAAERDAGVFRVTNGIPGSGTPVAGNNLLGGLACASATSCLAVGFNYNPADGSVGRRDVGAVVPVTNGVPGAARRVAGTDILRGVACPSATSCVAVGGNASHVGVVVPINNGVPGAAVTVSGTTEVEGVACTSATSCVAVGRNGADVFGPSVGVVVPITNGIPGAATSVAGTYYLDGVACTSATSCLAGGSSEPGGVVVPITNGIPGAATTVAGTDFLLGVACSSATSCVGVGENFGVGMGVVVPLTNGIPGPATTVAGTDSLVAVACSSATSCLAGGESPSYQGVVVAITNRPSGAATTAPGVSAYRLTNNPLVVAGGSTPKSGRAAKTKKHKKGTTFRYTLSEAAAVKIVIAQRRSGRRKHKKCVAPTRKLRRASKCTRILVKGTLTRTSHQGANSVAFSGRIESKTLTPGSYQATLTATAIDNAKNTSRAQTISFRIVKR